MSRKPTTPRAATPRKSTKTDKLAQATPPVVIDPAPFVPDPEQVAREAEAAAAEEAANLAREAEEIAAEEAEAATKKHRYDGPMLLLRERQKRGCYTKAANGQLCCADDVAQILGTLPPPLVIRACIVALGLEGNPYLHLNIGQQSMNLRNKLRGALTKGLFGFGVVREAVEVVQEAAKPTAPAATTPEPEESREAIAARIAAEEAAEQQAAAERFAAALSE